MSLSLRCRYVRSPGWFLADAARRFCLGNSRRPDTTLLHPTGSDSELIFGAAARSPSVVRSLCSGATRHAVPVLQTGRVPVATRTCIATQER